MKQLFSIFFTALLAMQSGYAQEQKSLLECVQIAIENNIDMQVAQSNLDNAELDYLQSKRDRYPTLNGNTSHSLNFGRSLDYTTYNFNTNTTQSNSFGLSAGATLFAGGRLNNNIRLQEMLKNRSETSIQSLKDQIAITVAGNYMQALLAKEQITTAENVVEQRKLELKRTTKLIENGVTAGSTKYDIESQLVDAEFQAQQAKNNFESALLQLKQSMVYPLDKELDVITPEIAVPSIEYLQSDLHPKVVYENALLTQGVITGAEQDIKIAEQNIKLAKSQRYPTVSIGGSMNTYQSDQSRKIVGTEQSEYRIPVEGLTLPNQNPYVSFPNTRSITAKNPFFDQLNQNRSQGISLSVGIPIFNKGATLTQIKKAENAKQQSALRAKSQQRDLEQRIYNAYMQAEVAYKQYKANEQRVNSLTKVAEFAEKRYKIGSASIYDYLNSKNNLANAKLQLAQAKYDYIYKVKILEFYKENKFKF